MSKRAETRPKLDPPQGASLSDSVADNASPRQVTRLPSSSDLANTQTTVVSSLALSPSSTSRMERRTLTSDSSMVKTPPRVETSRLASSTATPPLSTTLRSTSRASQLDTADLRLFSRIWFATLPTLESQSHLLALAHYRLPSELRSYEQFIELYTMSPA